MKNLKRIFSAVLAMIFVLSAMPVVMAEGEATGSGGSGGGVVEPEIRLYRTYENYTGGNHVWYTSDTDGYIFNNGGIYGSWHTKASSDYSVDAVQGFDGKAAAITVTDRNSDNYVNGTVDDIGKDSIGGRDPFGDISDGKLYISIDMWKAADAADKAMFWNLKGSIDADIYALCWQPGVQWCKESQSWMTGERSTDFMTGGTNKNRAEIIIDPEAGTIDKYFNGSYAQTQTFTPQTIKTIQGLFATGHIIDNLVAVYYPEGCVPGTFSLNSAEIDTQANTIKVALNSDVTDADGANGSAISAPYGITLADVDETSFSVANGETALTVTGVTYGVKNGEYIVAVAETLAENTVYTVTANSQKTGITGEVVNENAKTATTSYSTQPEIMFYRDYENYIGGNNRWVDAESLGNQYKNYGTLDAVFDNDWGWGSTSAAEGLTGKGFVPAREESKFDFGSMNKTLPDTVKTATDGKIYISFTSEDIPDVANDGNTAVVGIDGHRYFGFDHGTAYSLSRWGSSAVNDAIPETGADFYKIDIVFDLEEKIQTTYINNVVVGNNAWNVNIANPASSRLNFWFENGVIIDNLAILYYPENITNQTFSITSHRLNADGTISVFLNSDAVDSDGKGSDTKSTISAPYGIALPSTSQTAYTLSNDTFSIDGLTVKSVTRGALPNEYVIAVEEEIAPNTVYTVQAKAGLKDILGATINSNASSVEVLDATEPVVLFYRDYEDFTASGEDKSPTRDPFNQAGIYGIANIQGDGTWDKTTVTDGIDGKAAQINASHITDLGAVDIKSGKIYFALNQNVTDTTNREDTIVLNKDTESGVVFGWYPGTTFNNKTRNWGGSDYILTDQMNGAGYYKIEGIIDAATGIVDRYINGIYVGRVTLGEPIQGNITAIRYAGSKDNYIDNLALIYLPEGLIQQKFSMTAAEVNTVDNTISVFLKSDAVDSDAANGSSLAAAYGITLPSTDASNASYTLANDTFAVEGLNVTAVTRGERSGEYILSISETLSADDTYKVTAKNGLTDILGAVINSEKASATTTAGVVEEEPKYEISAFDMKEGTATVTYTNTTETPENFVIMVASYVNGIMSEVVTNNITAVKGDVDKVETVSLSNGVDGKTVKAFLWDADTLMPLAQPVVKNFFFRILGRYEETSDGYSLNWPNSGVEFAFDGTEAAVNVSKVTGTAYFTPYIDGVAQNRIVLTKGLNTIASGLSDETHTIKLVRSSEARIGRVWITDVKAENFQPFAKKDRLIEFYGDSYTAGYGNIGPDGSAESTDAQKAYAVTLADYFNADANLIAYSGKGMLGNGSDNAGLTIAEMSQYADIVLNTDTKMPSLWNFSKSNPDLVVIFLGTNDSGTAGLSADDFEDTYKEFIATTRERYGNVKILCLTRSDIKLAGSVEAVVTDVKNAGDSNIAFYKFESFGMSGGHSHPSAAEAAAIADELKVPVKELMGW